jgi:hypothetical protein
MPRKIIDKDKVKDFIEQKHVEEGKPTKLNGRVIAELRGNTRNQFVG